MSNENGSLSSIQAYLVSLASEYRLLKELQSRSEIQLNETTQKSEKLSSQVLMLNEHYKAYCQTLADVLEKLSNMFVAIEKIKEQLNSINIRLEQIDGNRARCGDKFEDMTDKVENLDNDIRALSADVDTISNKLQSILTIVKTKLALRLTVLEDKVTKDLPNQILQGDQLVLGKITDVKTDKDELEERLDNLEKSHNEIITGFKHLKIYGGICIGIITLLSSLRTLGWI